MLTALSGTPGTGKSTVAALLRQRGHSLRFVDRLAEERGALGPLDPQRDSREVDLRRLGRRLPEERPLLLVGHLAHRLPVDRAVVLRCHPSRLERRLRSRGWNDAKVRENVEAEALGVIAHESREIGEVYELDTTEDPPSQTVADLESILRGEGEGFRLGHVDWGRVILGWY